MCFVLTSDNISKETREKLNILEKKLAKYKKKEQWIGDNIYLVDQDSELYEQVISFYKQEKKEIEFIRLSHTIKIDEEERDKAVAYIPWFPDYYCEEYEDISNEYKECSLCYAKEKEDNLFYVQPKGYIKKHKDDYGMAGFDGTGELLLLPKIVERLVEEGIDKKYFQPVLSKRKVIMGYIYVTKNILPKDSLIDPNYKLAGECPKCGNISMKEDEEQYYFQEKKMKKEVVERLEDVNYTYEFYDEYRETIVSKKVAGIIMKYVPYAEFIPVFQD